VGAFAGIDLAPFRDLPRPLSVPFSGGRSSGMLLCCLVEANGGLPEGAVVNFQNTGLELPPTLDFIRRVEVHLGINVVRLEYDRAAPGKFAEVGHNSLSRDGEPFDRLLTEVVPERRDGTAGVRALPNPVQRTCTANLKTKTAHRHLRSLGWPTKYYAALGYRFDEESRVARKRKLDVKGNQEGGTGVFPLFDAKITSDDVHWFWRQMPFDLELDSNMGNCDFCFMKSEWKIKEQMLLHPDRAQWWINAEQRAATTDRPSVFRKDRPSYAELFAQVQAGNLEGSKEGERCGTCGD
jgi:3'-phosphoadenosine 5'-phosphosulfate sulfotransferase (PAPS reductase)/FAD synthetase